MTTAERTDQGDEQTPSFAIVLRGYDRDQVDEYLFRHESWVKDWRQRATAAEAAAASAQKRVAELSRQVSHLEKRNFTSTPESFEALGDQVGGILKAAFDAAETMRTEAEAEARQGREKAQSEIKEMTDTAQREVRELREKAQRDVEARRAAVDQEIRRLVERRDSVITHLGSLQRDLQALLGAGPADAVAAVVDLRDGQSAEKAAAARTR